MDLAVAVGATPAQVSGWETRGVEPSLKYLTLLADALGITVDELLKALAASRPVGRARDQS
jgi:transcriptional regulator with XRE-family HTH domain